MHRVVFLRHGQSVWNRDRRYTGWVDVGLSADGRAQAERAGRLLCSRGFRFDLCFSSVLKRSDETLELVLAAMGDSVDREGLEVRRSWRLNERHYGALQGVEKDVAKRTHPPADMFRWVRSFDERPPPIDPDEHQRLREDPLYADVSVSELPACESLHDTLQRTLPYWESSIAPAIRAGRQVLVVAHLNSLRALIKHLEGVSNTEIAGLSIHAGEPFVVEFSPDLTPLRRYYLQLKPGLALKRMARRVMRRRKAKAWISEQGAEAEG